MALDQCLQSFPTNNYSDTSFCNEMHTILFLLQCINTQNSITTADVALYMRCWLKHTALRGRITVCVKGNSTAGNRSLQIGEKILSQSTNRIYWWSNFTIILKKSNFSILWNHWIQKKCSISHKIFNSIETCVHLIVIDMDIQSYQKIYSFQPSIIFKVCTYVLPDWKI